MLYQEWLFRKALSESKVAVGTIKIDHKDAYSYNNEKRFEILYPLSLVQECKKHWKNPEERKFNYCFRGLNTPKRQWIVAFKQKQGPNAITFTNQRATVAKTTNSYDMPYYLEMTQSKFVLCPAGDFNWTYRFSEAIMCGAIPIIQKGTEARNMQGFKYYYTTDPMHIYDPSIVQSNYDHFVNIHTLMKH